MPYDTPINATDATFDRAALQTGIPVVAVIWSDEKTPRHDLDRVLEQAARSYAGEVLVVRLEAGDAPQVRARYDVERLPQFLFFRRGKLVARATGMPSMPALRPWIEYVLGRGPEPTAKQPRPADRSPTDSPPLVVTDTDFDQVVLKANVPVMVDFWASWCSPCRSMAALIEDLARSFAGRALVAKLDVDANQTTARRYNVMSIPTFIFFQDGREVDRLTGAQPKHVLQRKLEALL